MDDAKADRKYTGHMLPDLVAVVDNLIYASYRANRLLSPEVTPERWAYLYPSIEEMEERFQKETTNTGAQA
jgi:hypothetical protein